MTNSKLYIAVLDEFPDFMVPTLVAHTVLNAHIHFAGKSAHYDEWLRDSFKKVVVRVNQKEFNKITDLPCVVGYERSTLDGMPSCAVVEPYDTDQVPNVLKFAKMWKPVAVA